MGIRTLLLLCCSFSVCIHMGHASHKNVHREERGLLDVYNTILSSIKRDANTVMAPAKNVTEGKKVKTSSTTVTTSSTASTDTTLSTTVSTSTTTLTTTSTETASTTLAAKLTTTVTDGCSANDELSKHCTNVPKVMKDINFWDAYYIIFSNDVLRALALSCSSGHWCLKDKFDFWDALLMERASMVKKSEIFNAVCNQQTCLKQFAGNFTKCGKVFAKMNFTLNTIDLLCDLKMNTDLSLECLQHVIAGIHVTAIDILRDDNHKQRVEAGFKDKPCDNPESQMTRTYRCIDSKCSGDEKYFASFQPWRWFINDVAQISKECGYKTGICADDTRFGQKTATSTTTYSTTKFFKDILGQDARQRDDKKDKPVEKYTKDTSVVIGLTLTTAVMVAIFLLILSMLWRKRRRQDAAKGGYSPLDNDGTSKGGYSPLMNDVISKSGYSPVMNDD